MELRLAEMKWTQLDFLNWHHYYHRSGNVDRFCPNHLNVKTFMVPSLVPEMVLKLITWSTSRRFCKRSRKFVMSKMLLLSSWWGRCVYLVNGEEWLSSIICFWRVGRSASWWMRIYHFAILFEYQLLVSRGGIIDCPSMKSASNVWAILVSRC